MKQVLLLFSFVGLSIAPKAVFAQGCSDAGVCTSGAMQPDSPHNNLDSTQTSAYSSYVQLAPSIGIGENLTLVTNLSTEIQLRINKSWSAQVKLPFLITSGDLGSTSGIGDLTADASWAKSIDAKNSLLFSAGFKIPIGKTDLTVNNRPLPMPYQTGLGTFDGLFGFAWKHNSWTFSTGLQLVLINKNNNQFLHSKWTSDTTAFSYFESNQLQRGNDALVKVEKLFSFNKFRLGTGLLVIYRIKGDRFENSLGNLVFINGSDGFTVNLTVSGNYRFSNHWGLQASVGAPAKVRESRPDGLTRAVVAGVGVRYYFKINNKDE